MLLSSHEYTLFHTVIPEKGKEENRSFRIKKKKYIFMGCSCRNIFFIYGFDKEEYVKGVLMISSHKTQVHMYTSNFQNIVSPYL